jgi:hypothetical protein
MFDITALTWTDISAAVTLGPGARHNHGFASDGQWLYVHNGQTQNGTYILSAT